MTTPSTATTVMLAASSIAANISSTASSDSTQTHLDVEPSETIFLQTTLAKGVAGAFVWAALFLTCQQVNMN